MKDDDITSSKYDIPFCDTEPPIEAYEKETKRINLFFIY